MNHKTIERNIINQNLAILIYRMLRSVSKPIVKGLHVFLHTVTLALVATGLSAMIEFKNGVKFPHLYSAHSWFGLIVVFLYISQVQLSHTFFINIRNR